ncbi:unnamed protein product [Rotaria magnacalcarata]|uniref:Uncharacterized protein n=1 Tax=Rotaria magnacalcarata TaxID=392030 RepID=A0A816LCH5_9BILA|nr:unnamed protein product [Rotaria magnacalcarata]CAF1323178.1 unnamed protein product [Rotaria magnacalcarata]CAF1930555.1 unnamed protein product [Rotaria magnacalcarata]CAF1932668.1 unnamed protein product [Rotaria magnacalcarata]CAF2238956.1 unnamed protein product [Rotaria magnacalcarata]
MPREQVEWFTKESVHDSDKIQARQRCTYYSIVNVNKKNYPYLSSYEQEQTWTLTRTISNNHKRYQSSIENIHLTMPASSLKTKRRDYENTGVIKNRSNSLVPSQKCTPPLSSSSLLSLHSPSINKNSFVNPIQKTAPVKAITKSNSNSKINSTTQISLPSTKLMRTIPVTGEFVVRI